MAIEWLSSGYRTGVKQSVKISVTFLGQGLREVTSRAATQDLVIGKSVESNIIASHKRAYSSIGIFCEAVRDYDYFGEGSAC